MQEPKQTLRAERSVGPPSGLDRECFTAAIAPHMGPLVSAARQLLGSEDLAWDAVQETLFSLWQEESLPLHLHTWLQRTLVHRSLHSLRTRSRRRKHEKRAAAAQPAWSRREDPVYVLENQEIRSLVAHALAELAEEQRAVFVLRELEQLDYESIAEVLQVPVGTVRSRLNRSRGALRKILSRKLCLN
jgi:RNA polymerase sigma-70 factor (ECF subfamily)